MLIFFFQLKCVESMHQISLYLFSLHLHLFNCIVHAENVKHKLLFRKTQLFFFWGGKIPDRFKKEF